MKLFDPIVIRGMRLRNRIVMAPMATGFRYRNTKARDYYVERAKGGVSAILLGGFQVDALENEDFRRGIRDYLIGPVHQHGAKIGPQLFHGNQYPTLGAKGIGPAWVAPSAGNPRGVPHASPGVQQATESYCRELTLAEIQSILAKYAAAAEKAKAVGFDFVEVHGCHGHTLPHQFFSPLDNRRTDVYGGTLAGRMRFGIEVANAIRNAVGDDLPFFWRLSSAEGLPGGFTLQESVQFAAELVKAGVDVIDVTFGHESIYEPAPIRPYYHLLETDEPMGGFASFAEEFKRKLAVPVITVGRINSPKVAEDILSQGKADLIAIGRQLLADPHWPNKVAANQSEDITPCIGCNTCHSTFLVQASIKCSVNAFLGRESEHEASKSKNPKKVFVVGGGPGGMEAARIAALSGHQVTLFEKDAELGGQLNAAKRSPRKKTFEDFIKYLRVQIEKAGVQVKLRTEVNDTFILKNRPDAVIFATGILPLIPEIRGMNTDKVVTASDVLIDKLEVGRRVIILGGELVACDLAEFLVEKGKKVTMTRRGPTMAARLHPSERQFLLCKLGGKGVTMLTGVKYEEIVEDGLILTDRRGKKLLIEADTIILATGSKPNNELAKRCKEKGLDVYLIGDCQEPRQIVDAIEEGVNVGRKI